MRSVIIYFTGGASYSVPNDLSLTYILTQLRFLFFGFVVSYYFEMPYTVLTMALSVILDDLRFFIDFSEFMDKLFESEIDDDEDE